MRSRPGHEHMGHGAPGSALMSTSSLLFLETFHEEPQNLQQVPVGELALHPPPLPHNFPIVAANESDLAGNTGVVDGRPESAELPHLSFFPSGT